MSKFQFLETDFLTAGQSNLGESPLQRYRRGLSSVPLIGTVPFVYPPDSVASIGTGSPSLNQLRMTYIYIAQPQVLTGLVAEVTAIGAAGAKARIGLWNGDANTLYPTTLVADSGDLDCTTLGIKNGLLNGPINLPGGQLYWIGVILGTAAGTMRIISTALPMGPLGLDATNLSNQVCGWIVNIAYGALPNPFPAGATLLKGGTPMVMPCVQFQ